jgi:8-oxo-dGTP pyrophosphatase MutT (NUDIX family)
MTVDRTADAAGAATEVVADVAAGSAAVGVVLAAGGVVLDTSGPDTRVLVVHRPAYDDWSLPKGHVDAGEELAAAALREVAEETGVAATIVRDAGRTAHPIELAGGPAVKQVHWFVMRPLDDADPASRAPDVEVDRAAWWSTSTALDALTYAGERTLLAQVLAHR